MNQRDLLELEQAARTIVAVVERNRISDETAAERRENFILLPGGGNYQPQIIIHPHSGWFFIFGHSPCSLA